MIHPFISTQLVEAVLKGAICRHGGCVGEDDLAQVDGDVAVAVNVSRDPLGSRPHVTPVRPLERAELAVRDVDGGLLSISQVLHAMHGLQGGKIIAWLAKVVCMDMNGVG